VIELPLCIQQPLTEFVQVLFFLTRVLFDVSQCLALLFKLPAQVFQPRLQLVAFLACLLCLPVSLLQLFLRARQVLPRSGHG
jgi:hypothetical protein